MPIRQLKPKQARKSSSFTTHSFGKQPSQQSSRTRTSRSTRKSTKNDWLAAMARPAPKQRKKRVKKTDRKKRILRFSLRAGLILFLLGGIVLISLIAIYSRDLPDPNKIIERDVAQSTKIYDRTGEELLYEIHGAERRTLIELTDIPQYAIDATIATEDKNFYKHGGISIWGIIRGQIVPRLQGKRAQGGSTLTQQLIKNAILDNERSISRKLREWILSYRLEKKFTKEEILKLYFNEIPYGSTAYGIETAAHIYFDKSASDITLAEAAILAALPQAPSYYSPYGSHVDELMGRQRAILNLMVEQNYITEEEAESAKNEELEFKRKREDITAPHFVFMVKEKLAERYGERLVEQGGLKIITTIDAEKQKIAEEVIEERAEQNLEQYEAQNAALVSIDVETGEILAMVGSRDFFDDEIDGQVNVATSLRQPGSSLKPLIYAEAFNRGYRPDTTLYDVVTTFNKVGDEYKPHNYDSEEHGPVSLRTALQGSLNIPAVKLLYLVGVGRAVELAQELGYTSLTDPDRYGLSLVLGGGEVRLLEHVNAFGTFAREGITKPYVSVLRVEDYQGTVLEEHKDQEGKRVLDRNVIHTLNSVLTDNEARAYAFGENNYLTLAGRPAAAKTGTTNDYRDAWTIGYTPTLVTGVWVGNADNTGMKRGAAGGAVAAPIWQSYMNKVLSAEPVKGFKTPLELEPCSKPMLCGGVGKQLIKINIETGKLAGPYTPPSKIREVAFQETHSILHYINRNDIFGPVPEDPNADPQYSLWEEPIQLWAEEEGITNQETPTDEDDKYHPEDQPTISISSPSANAILKNISTKFSVNTFAKRGVDHVDYYLNDILVGSSNQSPFNLNFTASPVTPNGVYTLIATAIDDIGNEKSASINITLDSERPADEWNLSWITPTNNIEYELDQIPQDLNLSIKNPSKLKKIDFYYSDGSSRSFIGYKNVNGNEDIVQSWDPPDTPGQFSLSLIISDSFGTTYNFPKIYITILDPSEEETEE